MYVHQTVLSYSIFNNTLCYVLHVYVCAFNDTSAGYGHFKFKYGGRVSAMGHPHPLLLPRSESLPPYKSTSVGVMKPQFVSHPINYVAIWLHCICALIYSARWRHRIEQSFAVFKVRAVKYQSLQYYMHNLSKYKQ